jgi:hypothetical protein
VPVEQVLNVFPVFWMFVRQQQFRRRYHRTGLIAVHERHLIGPFPALADKPEPESTHADVVAVGVCQPPDGCFTGVGARLGGLVHVKNHSIV